ncbi:MULTISPECIES: NAD(P)H-dependent oxidoreductase [unclassified Nocardia]|uniref:NADPH-dependent FMN reductase n=1 Tax=unclassified Nocardia TaxID=2637762 RepID=UPI0024A81974|nr:MULTISPECIES: NAD(P)H-dependent oxidoreductase [unclassified Nocardia]
MNSTPTILLISGSTRDGSTNTAALRTVQAIAPEDVSTELYSGLVDLPQFVPGDAPAPEAVSELRRRLAAVDAVLFCTPEYAGLLPGSLKNLLEWVVGSGELNEKPVAWINVAPDGRGDGAVASLRTALGYVGAEIVDAACARVTVARDAVGPDGVVADGEVRERLAANLSRLVERAR